MSKDEIEAIKKGNACSYQSKVEEVLKQKEVQFKSSLLISTYMENDMFFLGRGLDYALAMEGSLKMKELTYIHSEAYAGGELKAWSNSIL